MSARASEKQNKSIILRLLIAVFCLYLFLSLFGLWKELSDSKAQLAELNEQTEQTERRIDELNNLLENGTQEEIIEKAARERLGYVYADEQVYVDLSGN